MDSEPDRPQRYQIVIQGYLDDDWSEWFEGLAIIQSQAGVTTLTGPLGDQAALHGVLNRLRDLGLPIVSLTRTEPGE
jgi:hypothetical protein